MGWILLLPLFFRLLVLVDGVFVSLFPVSAWKTNTTRLSFSRAPD